jgi:heme A synthase
MQLSRFASYAWFVLAYNLLVILWGAFVRATGAGAGCGNHWPTCNGEVIPTALATKTLIELVHRVSSAIDGLLVLALVIWAWRAFPRGHLARFGAGLSLAFIIVESLLGAGLVRFGLVADDDSLLRAAVLAIHLVNTFILLAGLLLAAWWGMGGAPLRWRGQGNLRWALLGGLGSLLLVGATGAVTALGDTLFPAGSLVEGLRQDLSPTAHLLVQLRVIHPVLAILASLVILFAGSLAQTTHPVASVRLATRLLLIVVISQVAAGFLNLFLLAPVALQLLHLLLADLAWLAMVLTTATALAAPVAARQSAPVAERSPALLSKP